MWNHTNYLRLRADLVELSSKPDGGGFDHREFEPHGSDVGCVACRVVSLRGHSVSKWTTVHGSGSAVDIQDWLGCSLGESEHLFHWSGYEEDCDASRARIYVAYGQRGVENAIRRLDTLAARYDSYPEQPAPTVEAAPLTDAEREAAFLASVRQLATQPEAVE